MCSAEQRVDVPTRYPSWGRREGLKPTGREWSRIHWDLRASLCPFLLKSIWVAHTGQNHTHMVPAGSIRAGPHPTPTRGLVAASQYSHSWARCPPPWERVRRTHTAAKPEAPSLWPPDTKSRHVGKDPDAGKIEGKGEGADRGWGVGCISNSMDMTLGKLWDVERTEEPGLLQPTGSERVGQDSATEQ